MIRSVLSKLSTAEVEARLMAARIAFGVERSPTDLWDHPQLAGRNPGRTVDAPEGTTAAVLPPFGLEDREPRMGAVATLGEHTTGVEAWLDGEDEAR